MNSKRVVLLVLAAIVIAVIGLGAGFGIGSAVFKSTDAPPATTTAATNPPAWLLPFQGAANQIFSHLTSTNGAGVGLAYSWLANITDTFGNRHSGSDRIKNATEYVITTLKAQGFTNVHTEEAPIENWIRGEEVATLISPRQYPMAILGLGSTVPTPPEGITAPAYVVDTFEELDAAGKAGKVNGTILVYNEKWLGDYGSTVAYRIGASHASYYGAVAVLIRSVTPFSMYTPHTGVAHYSPTFNNATITPIPQASLTVEDSEMLRRMQDRGQALKIYLKLMSYDNGASHASYYGAVAVLIRSVTPFSMYTPHTGDAHYSRTFNNVTITPIPQASLTVEDSEMLRRMQDRGQALKIYLKLMSYDNGTTPGSNIIFEWTGSQFPNEYIVLTGHFDSWDVGQGAMDDGGGCAVAWNTLMTLKNLGLQPKRTIRGIFWAGEEMGYDGVRNYWQNHKNSTEKWVFAFESDEGAFKPSGPANNTYFEVKGNATAVQRLNDIAANTIAANGIPFSIRETEEAGGEVGYWQELGTPVANYINDEKVHGYYFYFHHTNADTMTVLTKEDLDYVTAVLATYTHIIANMDKQLSVP